MFQRGGIKNATSPFFGGKVGKKPFAIKESYTEINFQGKKDLPGEPGLNEEAIKLVSIFSP